MFVREITQSWFLTKENFERSSSNSAPLKFVQFSMARCNWRCSLPAQVKVYNSDTNAVSKTLSKFAKTAFGGRLRADGRLLCAGSDDAAVRVFDVHNKHLLRHFKGHERWA